MHITILIPHYGTGQMTSYSIAQLLKFKGSHHLDIVVIDNNAGDGSLVYLDPFMEDITIVSYPSDRLQSHGIAFDYVLPLIQTEFFFTMESDSFPTVDNWLDVYQGYTDRNLDAAYSLLQLSGGEYGHPCGAMYRTSVWKEAKEFVKKIPYYYFPNMAMSESFACHLMVHSDLYEEFIQNPDDYIELSKDYLPYERIRSIEKLRHYWPVGAGVFHNGMGNRQESVRTYGLRTNISECSTLFFDNKHKLIRRIGAEPGQFFSWWLTMMGKSVYQIPTQTKWIDGKVGHQQEYTINEAGFKHLWGISAYKDVDPNNKIAKIKQREPIELYNSLPEHQKIKTT